MYCKSEKSSSLFSNIELLHISKRDLSGKQNAIITFGWFFVVVICEFSGPFKNQSLIEQYTEVDSFTITYWAFHKLPQICTASAYAHVSCSLQQMQYNFCGKFLITQYVHYYLKCLHICAGNAGHILSVHLLASRRNTKLDIAGV